MEAGRGFLSPEVALKSLSRGQELLMVLLMAFASFCAASSGDECPICRATSAAEISSGLPRNALLYSLPALLRALYLFP